MQSGEHTKLRPEMVAGATPELLATERGGKLPQLAHPAWHACSPIRRAGPGMCPSASPPASATAACLVATAAVVVAIHSVAALLGPARSARRAAAHGPAPGDQQRRRCRGQEFDRRPIAWWPRRATPAGSHPVSYRSFPLRPCDGRGQDTTPARRGRCAGGTRDREHGHHPHRPRPDADAVTPTAAATRAAA